MKVSSAARLALLRKRALSPVFSFDEMYLHFFERYAENAKLDDHQLRYADAFAYALAHVTPSIGEGELIVGKCDHPLSEAEARHWRHLRETVAEEIRVREGQDSHMAIDYEKLLRVGLDGIQEEIDILRRTAVHEQLPFYQACSICLKAVTTFSERYAVQAGVQAAACTDPVRQQELIRLAEICTQVPRHPAETFYQAVQSVNFITFCLCYNPLRPDTPQQFQLGHPDRYLWPYYQRERAAGTLTIDFVRELLDGLALQINHHVPHGLSSGFLVGGRDASGDVVANELTALCLQTVGDLRLVYPAVGLCVCTDTPNRYLEQACMLLASGCTHPAIFNDEVITKGLQAYGITKPESHEYIHSTCVEITPVGASNTWVASPYTNLPQLLLLVLDREYSCFDDLLQAFYRRLDDSIRDNFNQQNRFRQERSQQSCNPLLSCFVRDCLIRGLDLEKGGARYNWIMPSFVGMSNLVDSLYAIKKYVFDEPCYTIAELRQMLDRNFSGCEAERLHLLNDAAKYGNNVEEVDSYFTTMIHHLVVECKRYTPDFSNARLVPSVFCWIMHELFGRETGATPDGRKAGFPLGDGSGPCQGRELRGPTASILSSTKWPHWEMTGGVAVNMKFSKAVFTADSCRNLIGLIKTYLQRGGFELQINVLDRETLLDAQKHPEQHQDLLVRIGGYSDYFVRLSENMQSEVLARTAHTL